MSDNTIAERHATGAFVGADRRAGAVLAGRRPTRALAATLLAVPITVVIDSRWSTDPVPGSREFALCAAGLGAALALSVIASAVMSASYRHSGRAPDVWMAVALALLAVVVALQAIPQVVPEWRTGAEPMQLMRGAASLCVLLFGARGAFGPAVDARVTGVRAARSALVALACGSAVMGFASALPATDGVSVRSGGGGAGWPPMSAFVALVAASVAFVQGLRSLSARLAAESRGVMNDRVLAASRDDAERTERARRDEREHDMVTALLAIEAAVAGIEARGPGGDRTEAIAAAVSTEIARLRRMLRSREPCSARLVRDVRDILAPVLLLERARNPGLHDRLAAGAVTDVPADVLARVVQLLLDNARQHAPGARVQVTSRRFGDRIEIAVRDDGCTAGLSEPSSGVVVRRSRGREPRNGVGLLSARRLIEECGGSLRVEPAAGGGMAFFIDVPVAGSDTYVADHLQDVAMITGRRRTDHRRARVLRSAAA